MFLFLSRYLFQTWHFHVLGGAPVEALMENPAMYVAAEMFHVYVPVTEDAPARCPIAAQLPQAFVSAATSFVPPVSVHGSPLDPL